MDLILKEIQEERQRQYKKGFNFSHDDSQSEDVICDAIIAYAQWAKQMNRMKSPEKYRRRMMQIGAMAIAACESFDRKN